MPCWLGPRQSAASSGWERCIDRLAVGHLTLAAAAAGHPLRRMCEVELAAHVLAARSAQIGDDASAVALDERWRGCGAPVVPADPAGRPSRPQRADVIDRRSFSDLKELSAVSPAVGQ